MRKKELYDRVIAYFEQAMPVAETELHYEDPFQLLVAVILSAQCTDKRFRQMPDASGRRYGATSGYDNALPCFSRHTFTFSI